MAFKNVCFCIIFCLFAFSVGLGLDSEVTNTKKTSQQNADSAKTKNLVPKSNQLQYPSKSPLKSAYIPYQPTSRIKYLLTSSSIILGGTVIGAGVLYLMPTNVTNWDKSEITNIGRNWARKTARGPVVDGDDWFLNWITHPYWGAVYYMQPRTAGFSWAESTLYSIIASSIFWEYGVEAFAEVPSWQDLIITPAAGAIFGEIFYRASLHIRAQNDTLLGSRILGKGTLWLMDPIGMLMQDLGFAKKLGIYNKNQISSLIVPTNTGNSSSVRLIVAMRW